MNLRPSGYEPDELPDCSTPRRTQDDSNQVKDVGKVRFATRVLGRPRNSKIRKVSA